LIFAWKKKRKVKNALQQTALSAILPTGNLLCEVLKSDGIDVNRSHSQDSPSFRRPSRCCRTSPDVNKQKINFSFSVCSCFKMFTILFRSTNHNFNSNAYAIDRGFCTKTCCKPEQYHPTGQNRQKSSLKKSSLKECVFVNSALKIECQIVKNTLLRTVFFGMIIISITQKSFQDAAVIPISQHTNIGNTIFNKTTIEASATTLTCFPGH